MNSASLIRQASSTPSTNRASRARLLRALRAFASTFAFGYTGAPGLPRQRFVRTAAAFHQRLRSHQPLCLRSRSDRAPVRHCGWLRWRACNPSIALRASRSIVALLSRHASVLAHRARGRAHWGLTLRSTGPAGTCFDLRSASARRAGYLYR
jgi:hypothetical protein